MSYKESIADAVLIVNWAITEAEKHPDVEFVFANPVEAQAWILQRLRHIQGHLLEAYREEMNEPWSRFYETKQQNSTFGRAKKANG